LRSYQSDIWMLKYWCHGLVSRDFREEKDLQRNLQETSKIAVVTLDRDSAF